MRYNYRIILIYCLNLKRGRMATQLVEALRYKAEGRGTMALVSTQPLTEMAARNNSFGVKAAGVWQPYHLYVLIVLKSGILNLLAPSDPVHACRGIALPYLYLYFRFFLTLYDVSKAVCELLCNKTVLRFMYVVLSKIYLSMVYKVTTYWIYRSREIGRASCRERV